MIFAESVEMPGYVPVDANMLTPILLIRAVIDPMITRGFGRSLNITSSGVKSPATYPNNWVSQSAFVQGSRVSWACWPDK